MIDLPASVLGVITDWQSRLGPELEDAVLAVDGSLASGLHPGYSPCSFSMNPDLEQKPGLLFELDLLLLISPGFCLDDATVRKKIDSVFHPERFDLSHSFRWGKNYRSAILYSYLYTEDGFFEFQIFCVNRPYLQFAGLWGEVFSPEEMLFHKRVRETIRAEEKGKNALRLIKGLQALECRWRLVASTALAMRGLTAPLIRLSEEEMQFLTPLADVWLSGAAGSDFLDRSLDPVPRRLMSPLGQHCEALCEELPREPDWVRQADDLQWRLKSRRAHGRIGA